MKNRIITSRSTKDIKNILSICIYGIVSVLSFLIMVLSFKRGNPDSMIVLYVIMFVFNLSQTLCSLIYYVFYKQGTYFKYKTLVENIFFIVWILLIIFEIIIASVSFVAFRIDLLVYFICELLTMAFLFFALRRVEFIVDKIKNKEKIKKENKEIEILIRKKYITYFTIFVLIFIIQLGSLFVSKIPPKIDDIFSENRTLQYERFDDGYYVTGIYYGKSKSIVIPSTYNGKNVVGIRSYALTDTDDIESITFGEYDEEGNLISSLKYIEENAIKLGGIKSITLPSTLEKIEKNAITCNDLEEININSKCDINLNSFKSNKLSSIKLKTDTVCILDFNGNNDVKMDVSKENYNLYRERNYDNRDQFTIGNINNTIVVNFETLVDDLYVDSWIIDLTKSGQTFNVYNLTNSSNFSTLINDTKKYNDDRFVRDESSTNDGYVFRGWYKDPEYKTEVEIKDSNVAIGTNLTLYAKWVQIRTVTLDWGEYSPTDSSELVYTYISSSNDNDSVIFPTYDRDNSKITVGNKEKIRKGFMSLKWCDNDGKAYSETKDMQSIQSKNTTLHAVWELEKPTFVYETQYGSETKNNINSLEFIYDPNVSYKFKAELHHESSDVTMSCKFYKADSLIMNNELSNIYDGGLFSSKSISTVSESGKYIFEVIAVASTGETSSKMLEYDIDIKKKEIKLSELGITAPNSKTVTYNGTNQTLNANINSSVNVITQYLVDEVYQSDGPINASDNEYEVKYTYSLTEEKGKNYYLDTDFNSLTSSIIIVPKKISVSWIQTSPEWDSQFCYEYDSKGHHLVPTIIGLCKNDSAFETYVNNNPLYYDVNEYTTTLNNELGNSNYVWDEDAILSKTWNITKKNVTYSWDHCSFVYDSTDKVSTLSFNGLFSSDFPLVSSNVFISNKAEILASGMTITPNTNNGTIAFGASQKKEYIIDSISFINKLNNNYNFTEIQNQSLSITSKKYEGIWSNNISTYSGEIQKLTFTVANIPEVDYEAIKNHDFGNETTFDNCTISYSSNTLVIDFEAKNAGTYYANIKSFVTDNFSFDENDSQQYEIKKRIVDLSWNIYDGSNITDNIYSSKTKKVLATVTNEVTGDIVNVNSYDNNEYVNYGSYTTVAKTLDNPNYRIGNQNYYKWNIEKKQINITSNTIDTVYDGKYHELVLTLSNIEASDLNTSLTSGLNITYSAGIETYYDSILEGSDLKVLFRYINAGTYSINLLGDYFDNYKVKTNIYSVNIDKLPITLDWTNSSTTYDGNNFTVNPYITNAVIREDNSILDTVNIYVLNNTNKNAGTYYAKLISIDNNNYLLTDELKNNLHEYTIAKKIVNISWDNTEFIFNAQEQYNLAHATNTCGTDEVLFSYSFTSSGNSVSSPISARNYITVITSSLNNNYALPDNNLTNLFTISAKELTLSWSNDSLFTYNKQNQGVTLTISGFPTNEEASLFAVDDFEYNSDISSLNKNVSWSSTNSTIYFTGINADNYGILINKSLNSNYKVTSNLEKSFAIQPKVLTFTWNNLNSEYDNDNKTAYATSTNLCAGDTVSFTYVNNVNKGAGTYYPEITNISNSNYSISSYSNEQLRTTQVITKKALTINWDSVSEKTYNGSYIAYNATIGGYVLNDSTFDVSKIVTEGGNNTTKENNKISFESVNATNYTYKILGCDLDNYSISQSQHTFTINPLVAIISWSNNTLTYNAENQTVIPTITNTKTNVLTSTLDSPVLIVNNNTKKDVGSYTAMITSIEDSNYTINNSLNLSLDYTINKKTLSISFESDDHVYDGNYHSATITISGLLSNDQIKLSDFTFKSGTPTLEEVFNDTETIKGSFRRIDAGSYNVTLLSLNNNYSIVEKQNTLAISPLDIVAQFSENGLTHIYTGEAYTISATLANAQSRADNGGLIDSIVLTLSETSFTNAKDTPYETYVTEISGTYKNNYNLVNQTATMNIVKKGLTASYSGYASSTYDGNSHNVVLTIEGLCGTDSLLLSDISQLVTGSTSNINGVLDYSTGTVTVTYSIKDACTYTFSATGITNGNYKLNATSNYNVTISPKTLSASWTSKATNTYSASNYTSKLTISGFVNNADATNSQFNNVSSTSRSIVSNDVVYEYTYINVGTYIYSIGSITNTNYTFTGSTSNTYKVEKASLTVTANPLTITYGDVLNGQQGSIQAITGFVGSEDVNSLSGTLSFVYNYNLGDPITTTEKTYTVVPTGYISNNYSITYLSNTLTVQAKELGYTWSNTSLTYNGSVQRPTISFTNLLSQDQSTFTYTLSDGNKNVGNSYTCELKSYSNTNYKVSSSTETTYEIKQKQVELVWDTLTFTYDGKSHTPTITVNANSLCGADSCTVVIGNSSEINAGTYSSTAASLSNSNYKLPAVYSKNFTIEKKTVTLTWDNLSFAYNGNDQKPVISVSNLVSGDTCIVSTNTFTSISASKYVLKATSLSNANYKLPEEGTQKEFEIKKVQLTITPNDYEIVFGTPVSLLSGNGVTYSGFVNSETTTVLSGTLTYTYDTYTNTTSIGTNYKYYAAGLSATNYELLYSPGKLSITRRPLTYSWSNTSQVYNGDAKNPTLKLNNIVSGTECTYTLTEGKVHVGTYDVSVTAISNDNYELPSGGITTKFTITEKEIDGTWSETSYTYNKTVQKPTFTISNLISGDECTVTISYSNSLSTNVGTYTATVTSLSNKDYKISLSGISTQYIINPKVVSLSWNTSQFTYNGLEQKPTATVTNACSGDECTVNDISVSSTPKDSGSYTIYATGLTNSNYTISNTSNSSQQFTIGKKTVGITWTTVTFTYDGLSKFPSYDITGLESGDSITATEVGYSINAGTYEAKLTDLSNNNYSLPTNNTHNFTINPKVASLTWDNNSYIYNKQKQAPSASVTNLCTGDSCGVVYEPLSSINVGDYTRKIISLSNTNYTLPTTNLTKSFHIGEKELILTQSVSSFDYDKTSHIPEISATNLCAGDSCEYSLSIVSGPDNNSIDAGLYTVEVTSISNLNYKLSLSNKTFDYEIQKKEITLSMNTQSFTYNGSKQNPVITVSNLINGDSCSLTTDSPNSVNAGNYSITVLQLSNTNYKLPSTGLTFNYSINPKEVTLSWSNTELTYNGSEQKPTVVVTNLIDEDECIVNLGNGSTNASSSITITATSVSNSNYKLPQNVNCNYSISKKEVTLNWSNLEFDYDKQSHKPTCIASSLIGSDTCTVTVSGEKIDAGEYQAQATALSNSNYKLPMNASINFKINKKEVGLSYSGNSFVYNGAEQKPTVIVTGLISGDSSTAILDTLNSINVNDYSLNVIGLSNSNYKLPLSTTCNFSITKAELTVTANNNSIIYGDDASNNGVTYYGFVNNDNQYSLQGSLQYEYGTYTVGSNVGEYPITVSGLTSTNYDITYQSGVLTVLKRDAECVWSNLIIEYNGSDASPIVSFNNVIDDLNPTIEYSSLSRANCGEYTATVTSLNNDNYNIVNGSTTFNIIPKTITVIWSNTQLVYDGSNQSPTAIITNLVSGDTCNLTITSNSNPGNYLAVITDISNSNYKLPDSLDDKSCQYSIIME